MPNNNTVEWINMHNTSQELDGLMNNSHTKSTILIELIDLDNTSQEPNDLIYNSHTSPQIVFYFITLSFMLSSIKVWEKYWSAT